MFGVFSSLVFWHMDTQMHALDGHGWPMLLAHWVARTTGVHTGRHVCGRQHFQAMSGLLFIVAGLNKEHDGAL